MSLITSSQVKWGTLIYEISTRSFCIVFLGKPNTNYAEPKIILISPYFSCIPKNMSDFIARVFVCQRQQFSCLYCSHEIGSTMHSQQMGSCKMPITEYTVTVQAVNQRCTFQWCYHFFWPLTTISPSGRSTMLSKHARAHSQAK